MVSNILRFIAALLYTVARWEYILLPSGSIYCCQVGVYTVARWEYNVASWELN
jgi:hypothetical protein